MKLNGKVTIITGGGNGIGAALARKFKDEGAAAIYVADLEDDSARAVADEVGGIPVQVDVTSEEQVTALIRQAEADHGHIDLMVSNAGVGFPDIDTAASTPNENWETSWGVNVMAHVYAARAALPKMIERGEGYFLHTVSAAGLLSQIGSAAYSTTKHAAIGFGEHLAIAHGDDGIKVSLLCPQGVATRMLGDDHESSSAAQHGVLTPEEVADCVVEGLDAESFLILPHPIVTKFMNNKISDYDRWIGGMQKYRRSLGGSGDTF